MKLRIKRLHEQAILPRRQMAGDSGLDLYALLPDGPVTIPPGERLLLRTGIAIELPEGFEGQVRPRSGLTARNGVQAALGTIDVGYRGEVQVALFNLSYRQHRVLDGDRIAQLVVCPVALPEVEEVDTLTETERGLGGFGSTGV